MEPAESVVRNRRSLRNLIQRLPENISSIVEHFFYRLGFRVAHEPVKWIIGCSVLVLLCLTGLLRFHQEKNPLKLWIPPNSDFVRDTEWLLSHFKEGQRIESVIFTAEDILQPLALYELNEITNRVLSVETDEEPRQSWPDLCFKIPIISGYTKRDRRESDFFDEEPSERMNKSRLEPSVHAPSDVYCEIFNSLPRGCILLSILDIWKYNSSLILNQTHDDIVTAINSATISPTLGHPINFLELLGGVERDEAGRVIRAKAVRSQWLVRVDFTNVNMNTGNDMGTSDWATANVLNWESALVQELQASSEALCTSKNQSMSILFEAGRSYGDISEATMFQDIKKVVGGTILITFYVLFILSRCNWVELRYCLTMAGLLCVGGAFIVAVGICSLFRVPYGPVHSSLPFMLMGLGVDDIFVMMASWKEVLAHECNRAKPIAEQIGLMLSHAGAAISITSLTDVVAFIIGASTILPSLESFCIYAAVGVLVTFILQVTFFVAVFTLDVRRVRARRNGVFPCIVHADETTFDPNRTISWRAIHWFYSKIVLTVTGKILIIFCTIVISALAGFGAFQLEQWFDPDWFLPAGSYLSDYKIAHKHLFPNRGHSAAIFIGDIDYISEYSKILRLTDRLSNMTVIDSIESWPHDFASFCQDFYEKDITTGTTSSKDFYFYLSKFLFSQHGGRYQRNFEFSGELKCGEDAPPITLAFINFVFKSFSGPHEWIPAMDAVKIAVKDARFSNYATVWSRIFGAWTTDKVITGEVTRNVILALVCVMATTIVLTAEPQTCFWIFLCVSLTLVDVCGFMYYWGLSVDIVSCIALELAVGLGVDYSAHVAHAFLNTRAVAADDNRHARALIAVRHIGAAVIYGAGSTLLAQIPLAFSQAYVFQTFFKIFCLVVLFGIWHGLLFLPVILSSIGPRTLHPTQSNSSSPKDQELQVPLNTIQTDN